MEDWRVEKPEGIECFFARGRDWKFLLLTEELPEEVTRPAEEADDPDEEDVPVPSATPRTPWCTIVQLPIVAYLGKFVDGN